jgi:DNA repair protein RecO (recombination protein O)
MEKFKTEGVVINAIPFRNYDCILTLFTPIDGLIKLFYRGAYSSKKGSGSGTTNPLSIVEIVYTKGRGDLYSCIEISVINHHLGLRNHLPTLEAACEMLKCISATQMPGKIAPDLYQLLLIYLGKLPQMENPQTLITSFRLKLLRYEGLLALLSHCSVCSGLIDEVWIYKSEAFCCPHTPLKALSFTKQERSQVEYLAFCRDLSQLSNIEVSTVLSKKIFRLFEESLAV